MEREVEKVMKREVEETGIKESIVGEEEREVKTGTDLKMDEKELEKKEKNVEMEEEREIETVKKTEMKTVVTEEIASNERKIEAAKTETEKEERKTECKGHGVIAASETSATIAPLEETVVVRELLQGGKEIEAGTGRVLMVTVSELDQETVMVTRKDKLIDEEEDEEETKKGVAIATTVRGGVLKVDDRIIDVMGKENTTGEHLVTKTATMTQAEEENGTNTVTKLLKRGVIEKSDKSATLTQSGIHTEENESTTTRVRETHDFLMEVTARTRVEEMDEAELLMEGDWKVKTVVTKTMKEENDDDEDIDSLLMTKEVETKTRIEEIEAGILNEEDPEFPRELLAMDNQSILGLSTSIERELQEAERGQWRSCQEEDYVDGRGECRTKIVDDVSPGE